MCILCVASRWSRRIVTMLPWLIIPLIILWALSQLLPPGFRFEVTSPRLACVGVLLVSLGWYELAMPRLSQWRERRKDMMRERRRIEAQEAAKWRKEATRRCRNCLSAYRDQSPGGGRFMCTFCGHVSKRPVLDVPGSGTSVPGAAMGGLGQGVSTNPGGVSAAGGGLFGRNSKGWNSRGWPDRAGWGQGRAWPNSKQQWPSGVAAWGAVNGAWTGPSWSGGGWAGTGAYWAGGGAWAGGFGSSYSGGFFSEKCSSADPHYGGILCAFFRVLHLVSFFKIFSLLFFLLRWSWSRLIGETVEDDSAAHGSRRGGQRRGEDVNGSQGTRGEKARRKAEEKKQARLEREQLEAEERRQREEVARLVEERRRLRDEKLEAERETEREAAAEREREIRREREAERRRQEKLREKEREAAKERVKDTDSDGSKRKNEKDKEKAKDSDKKVDGERKGDAERKMELKPQVGPDYRKGSKGAKLGSDACIKGELGYKSAGGNPAKAVNARYQGSSVKAPISAPKNGVVNQSNSYFWKNSGKSNKGTAHVSTNSSAPPVANGGTNAKTSDSSYSAWKVWPKGWGKGPSLASDSCMGQPSHVNGKDPSSQNGMQLLKSEAIISSTGDQQTPVGAFEQPTAQTKPWQRLFLNSNATPLPSADLSSEGQRLLKQSSEQSSNFVCTELASDPILTSSSHSGGGGHGHSSACLASLSMGSAVHVPASCPVLAPISAPSSANACTAHSSLPLAATPSVMSPMLVCSTVAANTSVITPLHARVSAPMQVPASVPLLPKASQDQEHVPQDQLPQILEPWATPKLCVDKLDLTAENKWKIWDAPKLEQIQLPLVDSWMPFASGDLDEQKDASRPVAQAVPIEPEIQWSSCLFPSVPQQGSPGRSCGDSISSVHLASSKSLWSDQSAFADQQAFPLPPRSWGDANGFESHQRVPAEFVDCITQEVMLDPVITADGHSYERAAIEQWLKFHDTSPITGEVLPPLPGGSGMGVDKTLRPNHILRGQIIEYHERMARSRLPHDTRDSGWRPLVGTSPWSVSCALERPQLGSFYTSYSASGAQSVWSFNGA